MVSNTEVCGLNMKWTKRLEKKIVKLCNGLNIETNIDWDVGHCDFHYSDGHQYTGLGAVRWYGYMMDCNSKLGNKIYVATCWTKLVYEKDKIWDITYVPKGRMNESLSQHKTLIIPDDCTEEKLLAFLEENLTRVLKAARLDKMYTALDNIEKDFK